MDSRVEITEEEAWAEIDKWFTSKEKEDDEYDWKFFADKYGLKRDSTIRRLEDMEKAGIVTSRIASYKGKLPRVWKIVKTPVIDEEQAY